MKRWNVYYWARDAERRGHAVLVWVGKARNAPHACLQAHKKHPEYGGRIFARQDDADPYKSDPTVRDGFRRSTR